MIYFFLKEHNNDNDVRTFVLSSTNLGLHCLQLEYMLEWIFKRKHKFYEHWKIIEANNWYA